jgi:hypothetical protein
VPDPTLLTFSLVDREVGHVKELVDLQFVLIERQRVESKTDTSAALAAALAAQEKAAGVLATFTSDQLKALGTQFTTSIEQVRKDIAELKEGSKADRGRAEGTDVNRQLADIKSQIDANSSAIITAQGAKIGASEQRVRLSDTTKMVFAFAGFILTLLSISGIAAALR